MATASHLTTSTLESFLSERSVAAYDVMSTIASCETHKTHDGKHGPERLVSTHKTDGQHGPQKPASTCESPTYVTQTEKPTS